MTNDEIYQIGVLINDETEPAQNTSTRVGGVIKGIGQNLADKDTAIAAEAARNGYYQCTVNSNQLAVTAPGFTLPAHGGNIRIKMSAPATGACTLNINGTGPKTLLYNGADLSSANTWEKDEIISVFYDPSGSGQYLASNSQGGGGKAERIKYDKSQSGLAATNVQAALDEQFTEITEIEQTLVKKIGTCTLHYNANATSTVAWPHHMIAGKKYRFHFYLPNLNTSGYSFTAYKNANASGGASSLFTRYGTPTQEFDQVVTWPSGTFNYLGGYNAGNAFDAQISVYEVLEDGQKTRLDSIETGDLEDTSEAAIICKSFVATSSDHSSNNDQLSISIPAYTPFYLRVVSSNVSPTTELRFVTDGTNIRSNVGGYINNWVRVVKEYEITAIGLTVVSSAGFYAIEVRKDFSDVIESKKTVFTLTSSAHSSRLDQISEDISEGDVFAVKITTSTVQASLSCGIYIYDASDNSTWLTGVDKLPFLKIFKAPVSGKRFGVAFNTPTAGTATFEVMRGSLIDMLYRKDEDSSTLSEKYTTPDAIANVLQMVYRDATNKAAFSALFFSDIHGQASKLKRIIDLGNVWKKEGYVSAILDGGDDTTSLVSTSPVTSWYDPLIPTSELPIVRAVGNHDAWRTAYWAWDTNQNIYNYMTDVTVTALTGKGLTVVQPSDVATTYKNYYYVDFPNNVRVIVLLSLVFNNYNAYYDDAQNTWLTDVLADSRTNSKHVLIMNHGGLAPTDCEEFDSPWCSFKSWCNGGVADTQHLHSDAVAAVDAFITAGGNFVAYIAGHSHMDYIVQSKNTVNKQFCFITSTANGAPLDGKQPSGVQYIGHDLLNMISIDTTNHFFKGWRIGYNTNLALQEHNYFCWDYANQKLITDR